MVEIIRNKWCDDLEDLLQCPICMIRPKTMVYQCSQGHHICEDCKCQLALCPTCSQGWSTARNRLAESLCAKLDDIKLSLIDPEGEINKLLMTDRVSVGSQTDAEATVDSLVPKQANNHVHNGHYPCRVGGCNVNLHYEPMINHIKKDHVNQYIELPIEGNVFQNIWFFDFVEQLSFDRAFTIPTMGTFFLKLTSDVFGNFTAFVLMLHNGFVSKQYTYQLEISCCAEHNTTITYSGEMCSCRTPPGVLREKSLNVRRGDIQRLLAHKKNLTCTVLLSMNPQADEQEVPQRTGHQKQRYSKNSNNGGWRNFDNGPKPRPLFANPPSMGQGGRPAARPRTALNGETRGQASRDGSRQSRGQSPHYNQSQNSPRVPIKLGASRREDPFRCFDGEIAL